MKIQHWLLLRGLAREARHWGSFPEKLRQQFPESKIHCLDLPGIGTETTRSSPHTVAAIVDDLRTRWLKLRKSEAGSWGILSISLGSMIALDWTSRHPDDFAAQVIMNTSAGDLSKPWQRLQPRAVPALLKSQRQPSPERREESILNCTTRLIKNKAEIAQQWGSFAVDPRQLRRLALRQLKAAFMFRSPAELQVPTLALLSKGDLFTNYSCTLALAHKLQLMVEGHPTAGHDLPLDAPAWVCEKIHYWLEQIENRSR